jgi:hypothetical protein
MYVFDEMLRKMQKAEAKLNPEAYAMTKILWRGMKDRSMDIEEFNRIGGGVALAPMSTTSNQTEMLLILMPVDVKEGFSSSIPLRANQGEF